MNIRGQTALVTGAASGIGRAIALLLAERGAKKVLLFDVDEAGLAETARGVTAAGAEPVVRRTDVSDLDDLDRAFADAAKHNYTICFNNAGIVEGPPGYPGATPQRIDLLIRINVTAVLVGAKRAIEHYLAHDGGVIINTGSTASVRPNYSDAAYRASKAAVHHFTTSCRELGETSRIRVNAIHPGGTDTPIFGKMTGGGETPDWMKEQMRNIRLWTPREIAEAALGLVEDDARFGENLILPAPAR